MAKCKNKFSHRHRDSRQVLFEMNRLAQESRMAERSAETASAVLCLLVTMRVFGFKQKRLTDLANDISGMLTQIWDGELDFEVVRNRVRNELYNEYCDLSEYTEDMLTKKKGSYEWFLDKIQLDPQNRINKVAVQYQMVCINCLMDRGYGKQRMERWMTMLDEVVSEYQVNKKAIEEWRTELLDVGGVWIENPKDWLTGAKFSVMTGVY